jgi:hypothetical protein
MTTITYTSTYDGTVTLPVGRDHRVNREGACLDICIERAVATGEIVKLRYVAEHVFCGQLVVDGDVPETTIAMGS